MFSVLALQHNVIFPNLNYTTPIEETQLEPETEFTNKQVDVVLSNSFGFGGNNSTLIFKKV